MKQRFFSILVFLVLFVVGLIYLNKVFLTSSYNVNRIADFKELSKKTNIDVLFFGSSYTYRTYNPLIIDYESKTISYNLASVALKTSLYDLVLKESLKYNRPKLIVIEAHYGTMTTINSEKDKGFQLEALDNMSLSPDKIYKTKKHFEPQEYLGVLSTVIRNHSNWSDVKFKDLSRKKPYDPKHDFYKGYRGSKKVIVGKKREENLNFLTKPITTDTTSNSFTERIKTDFINIAKIAKENDIELLFVSPPYIPARDDYFYFDEINHFCDSLQVNFLNLNDYYDEIGLTIDDFHDLHHLNSYGSIKTSQFLASFINSNYSLPDRSSEQIWKSSLKKLSEVEYVEENILDNLNFIFDAGFEFDEGINIEKIGLIETEEDTYKTAIILKDPINFTKIQELVFAMIYYPSDPNLLKSEVDRERGYKKTGVKINIKKMGDKYVFIHDEFKIIPQKHKSIRYYFYNKNGEIVGDELKLYNISFTPIDF